MAFADYLKKSMTPEKVIKHDLRIRIFSHKPQKILSQTQINTQSNEVFSKKLEYS
jgi:hypothetical protein